MLRLNKDLLGPDAVVWWAGERHALYQRNGGRHASAEGSFNGIVYTRSGPGAKWTRNANGGVDMGLRPFAPKPDTGVTMLIVGAPVQSASNRKSLLTWRSTGTNNPQIGLVVNANAAFSVEVGNFMLYTRNNAAGVNVVLDTSNSVDSGLHCWVAGNATVSSSGYIYRDGVALSPGTNQAMTGTYSDAAQLFAVGNAAGYTTDGAFVCDDHLLLGAMIPRRLPPGRAQELSRLLLEVPQIVFERRRIWSLAPASGGTTVSVGVATETDSAFAIESDQAAGVGLASETDTAQALTVVQTSAVGVASETDSAMALAIAQSAAIGLASETDSAAAVTATSTIAVGLASETDAPQTLDAAQSRAIGLASETDAAQAVDAVVGGGVQYASESDEAKAIVASQAAAAGVASETDAARPATAAHAMLVGLALEIDVAMSAEPPHQARGIGVAQETDSALPVVADVEGGSASAAEIWNYVLPNGKTAKQTVVEIHAMLLDLHLVHGLTLGFPLTVTAAARDAGTVSQTIEESGGTVTVTRQ